MVYGVDERGNMTPLVVMAVLVLLSVLSFAIDQGIAYAAKARQENALDAVRAACMDASFAFVAKNDENPGRAVADLAVSVVRAGGFEGRVIVWFYEAPASTVPATERIWTMGLQVQEETPTVFARGFGVDGLPVASHRVVMARPYSSERAWRPAEDACGRYVAEAGSVAVAFDAIDGLDGFPVEVADAARAALS